MRSALDGPEADVPVKIWAYSFLDLLRVTLMCRLLLNTTATFPRCVWQTLGTKSTILPLGIV